MKSDDPDFIDLSAISDANLKQALSAIQGYSKFASILWMRALREPTLDGVIVRRWSKRSARALHVFCMRHNCDKFLLRIDKYLSRWTKRRGGYIVPQRGAKNVIQELSREHVMVAMLEPLSPHRNLYSLACLTVPEDDKLVIEVVGPGFDTSDLLRSDLLPHERFEALISRRPSSKAFPADLTVRRTYIIGKKQYLKSVEDRLTKIGARLKNPAFPEDVVEESSKLRANALGFLRKTRQTLLLRHAQGYEPIPRSLLLRFALGVVGMLHALENRGLHFGPMSFSGMFTTRRRLIYWDFFPADLTETDKLSG